MLAKSVEINIDRALVLADRGLPVFPCRRDKAPACPSGFKAAVRHDFGVRDLFRDHPGPLIGVPTGEASGIDALDVDLAKHDSARRWWAGHGERLAQFRQHVTRSGGRHVLLRHHPGMRCSVARPVPGIDVRAAGGYVVWWPSAGFPTLRGMIGEWPDWLVEAVRGPEPAPRQRRLPITDEYLERRLRGLASTVARAREGERNSVLFWASRRLAELDLRSGRLAFAVEVLEEAARRCGLAAAETRRTIASGLGARHER